MGSILVEMVDDIFWGMLFRPSYSRQMKNFPSSESLKEKILISTKPPESPEIQGQRIPAEEVEWREDKDDKSRVNEKNVFKDRQRRDEQHALKKKNDCEKAKKEPMERLKRMRCWVILKRLMEGRDGWALKDPVLLRSTALEKKSKKPICLKDVEAKLRVYSTTEEFAYDLRHVISNALLTNPPGCEIYKIVERFSDSFEHKWESLKKEWAFEDRRKNIHKRRR
ncbi:transcription factor GTE12-like [Trifolium pratense]|uniref:transcription factor GTE12-like n=1 Tax=Trifolium pratense TaxID=57577 RepID=UPI001E690497|nr:transcription factor GTE12-like [Trifolium pratense]